MPGALAPDKLGLTRSANKPSNASGSNGQPSERTSLLTQHLPNTHSYVDVSAPPPGAREARAAEAVLIIRSRRR